MSANALRGEATQMIRGATLVLRPSFSALVAAEGELGPLFALVDRAARGELRLNELAALFWHCLVERPATLSVADVGEAVVEGGLANATPVLNALLRQILAAT